MANLSIRLSDRKRFLILKALRYAMDSASLWTYEPGPPVFELYLIGRAMMKQSKGRPLIWQGHLEPEEMKKKIDDWIESMVRMLEASIGPQPSSPEPASPHVHSESDASDSPHRRPSRLPESSHQEPSPHQT